MLATLRSWSSPFVYDDADWMAHSVAGWSVGGAPFRLADGLGGGLPWAAHGLLVMLHLLNGALLWRLARRWLSARAALVMLTGFWLHPLSLQAVFYVTAGREVWLTTWTLLALWGGLRGGMAGWTLGIVAVALAVMVKPSAAPIAIAVPLLWGAAQGRARIVTQGLVLALIGAGVCSAVPVTLSRLALRTWGVSLWRYAGLLLWPAGFSIVHDWAAVPIWLGGLAVSSLLALGVVAARRSRAAWWAWIWIVTLTLPRALVLNAPPLTEAQTYLPFLAIWALFGWAVDQPRACAEVLHG